MRLFQTLLIAGAGLTAASAAHAEIDLVSPETVHAVLDLRLAAADGETAFTRGGYGKTRYGGDAGGGWRAHPEVAMAALEWKPRLNWEWSAVVDAVAQPKQEHPIDLAQAYIQFKPVPRSNTRFTVKAGLFYPELSLEHDAPVWGVTNMITPSAINSWVGEEVKVVGVEVAVQHDFGSQQVTLAGSAFGYDDTAGTLLTYRGWALHDLKSTANGAFPLPPLSVFGGMVQDDETYSTLEVDHRVGWYVRGEWRPAGNLAITAFHYDNRGDRVGVTPDLQWAWDTRFTNLGVSWRPASGTHVLAQVLWGHTYDGFPTGDGLFADVSYRAAYALVSQDFGRGVVSVRYDAFKTIDHSLVNVDNNDERGWALTAAWRRPLGKHIDLRVEALHVHSTRPSRAYGGVAPEQSQTVLQTSLRFSY